MAIRVLAYKAGDDTVRERRVDELPALLKDTQTTLWVDLDGHGSEEEKLLLETFGFHPLVVEDAFNEAIYPKLEDFGDYLYMILHGVDRNAEDPKALDTAEMDLFLGDHYVVTHHSRNMRSIEQVDADIRRNPRLFAKGAAFVAHSLIDHMTDHYLPVMDKFDHEIDQLEVDIVHRPSNRCLERIFALKHSLQLFRRVAVHQKDILHRLARGEFERIPKAALPFYRDIYDHFSRVTDLAESYRDLVASALDAFLSVQSNKMNEIMKVLTLISTIMLPLTFIAGVYGMNFENMPELKWRYGYFLALGLMAVVAIGLVLYFKRRRWL